jgi:DNA-binding PadR family transcriptional regulator
MVNAKIRTKILYFVIFRDIVRKQKEDMSKFIGREEIYQNNIFPDKLISKSTYWNYIRDFKKRGLISAKLEQRGNLNFMTKIFRITERGWKFYEANKDKIEISNLSEYFLSQ